MRKHLLLITLICILPAGMSHGQDIRKKFGKPSEYEMNMAGYAADTSAAAVVLWQHTNIYYEIRIAGDDPIKLIHEYEFRIKVLRPEGVGVADLAIPYYSSTGATESVRVDNAAAYNLEGGKTVATALARKDIFDEQASDKLWLKKFSIPGVRAGTVIEYKYSIVSNIPQNIHDVEIQGDYPVISATGSVTIPTMFRYNVNMTGYESITTERKPTTVMVDLGRDGNTSEKAETITFTAKDIPALRHESNVWAPDDFRSRISFEISGLYIPGTVDQRYSTTWEDFNRQLADGDFGRNLKMPCPYAEEVKALKAETQSQPELIRSILRLVTSRIKWDKTYRLYADNIKKAVRDGSGSSACINFVLNSALREAGFETIPILLNPRHYGRMPLSQPAMNKINTFVLCVQAGGEDPVVLDATDPDNDLNVIPPPLMVDRARLYGQRGNEGWVNLTNLCSNMAVSQVLCEFNDRMEILARVTAFSTNTEAMMVKKLYRDAASEEEFIGQREKRSNIAIDDYQISDLAQKDVTEHYTFSCKADRAGDFIYINATLLPFMSESPFREQQRKMPVEFPYTSTRRITCMITVPEGYAVEELPKNERIKLADSGVTMQYIARVSDGVIHCDLLYMVNRLVYAVEEYPELFEIFGRIAAKSKSNIVLKKV